jgi:hypothetical protein
MKSKFYAYALVLLMLFPVLSLNGQESNKASDSAYTEVILEDFETTVYEKKNLIFTVTRAQEGDIAVRDQYPAPIPESKKYLGVKIKGKKGDVFKISPAKELVINKYCRSIEVWAYGKNFSGELSMILQDANNKVHRLVFAKLDFLGWRKLKVTLTSKVNQQDEFLNQNKTMKILEFQYRPGNTDNLPKWQYFYMDNISVFVREKYKDRQDDNW